MSIAKAAEAPEHKRSNPYNHEEYHTSYLRCFQILTS